MVELQSNARNFDVSTARHQGEWRQWVARLVVVIVAAVLIHFLVSNPNFEWDVVWAWFNAPSIMRGLWTTIWLAAAAMFIGSVLGLLLAIAKMSSNKLVSGAAAIYIWFFRGTPVLVQLIFWFNLAALVPTLSLGIPFGGPKWLEFPTNSLITSLSAALLGLALNEAAHMAEIIRGGLLSVDPGQREAASAFGMTYGQTLRQIILPQAMRAIIPSTGNQVINIVKATSQVSVIAMSDILYTVQSIYNRTFETIPLLIVAVIWYLIVTSILNIIQSFIEDHYARGQRSEDGLPGMVRRLRSWRKARQGRLDIASSLGDPVPTSAPKGGTISG